MNHIFVCDFFPRSSDVICFPGDSLDPLYVVIHGDNEILPYSQVASSCLLLSVCRRKEKERVVAILADRVVQSRVQFLDVASESFWHRFVRRDPSHIHLV